MICCHLPCRASWTRCRASRTGCRASRTVQSESDRVQSELDGAERIGPGAERVGPGASRTGAERVVPDAERVGPGAERVGPGAERVGPGAEQVGPGAERVGPGAEQVGPGGGDGETRDGARFKGEESASRRIQSDRLSPHQEDGRDTDIRAQMEQSSRNRLQAPVPPMLAPPTHIPRKCFQSSTRNIMVATPVIWAEHLCALHAVSVHAQEDSPLLIDQAGRGEMVSKDPIGCYSWCSWGVRGSSCGGDRNTDPKMVLCDLSLDRGFTIGTSPHI